MSSNDTNDEKTSTDVNRVPWGMKDSKLFQDCDVVYKGRYAGEPTTAVLEALATVFDRELTEIPPLYEFVDLDSLNTMFREPESMRRPGEILFPVEEYLIHITSDGWIIIYDEE